MSRWEVVKGIGLEGWIGFIWLRIEAGGGFLWTLLRTFVFHKSQGIS